MFYRADGGLVAPNILFGRHFSLEHVGCAKRNGTSSDPAREIEDLYKCAKLLDMAESRWVVAGRLRGVVVHHASCITDTD
jgi:hypothetical protein